MKTLTLKPIEECREIMDDLCCLPTWLWDKGELEYTHIAEDYHAKDHTYSIYYILTDEWSVPKSFVASAQEYDTKQEYEAKLKEHYMLVLKPFDECVALEVAEWDKEEHYPSTDRAKAVESIRELPYGITPSVWSETLEIVNWANKSDEDDDIPCYYAQTSDDCWYIPYYFVKYIYKK